MQGIHTILFVQPGDAHTRTFVDYETPYKCIRGVLKIYENHLREQNPESLHIVYTIYDLFVFLNELKDICCLIYDELHEVYVPYNRKWIKEQVYLVLKNSFHCS